MNRRTPVHATHAVLALLLFAVIGTAQDADRKGSPFEGLRWKEKGPEVRVANTWYEPLKIQGVAVKEILAFCEKRWPGKQRKRFGEDLVEALQLMGHRIPSKVDLELKNLGTGKTVVVKGVAVRICSIWFGIPG